MLRAVWKSKQPGVRRVPLFKKIHNRIHQTLRDAAVPKIRTNREWTKEADTAPVRCEIRTDHFSANLSSKRVLRIREPASANVGGVAHESHRVWQTDECSKRESHDRIRIRELTLSKRTYGNVRCGRVFYLGLWFHNCSL